MRSAKYLLSLSVLLLVGLQACTSKPVLQEGEQTGTAAAAKTTATDSKQPPIDPAVKASFEQALSAIAQGRDDQAIALLTEMDKRYPGYSGPQANIGLIYFRQGDMTRAEAAFRQALTINPNNAVAHNHLGIIYRQQGKFAEAEKAYLSAIAARPDYANAHLNLGILYDIYLLKLNNALQHYQQFQSLQASEDDRVKNWIVGLKRRIDVSK